MQTPAMQVLPPRQCAVELHGWSSSAMVARTHFDPEHV